MEKTSLNTIIDVNDRHEALNFISGGLNALLSNIHVAYVVSSTAEAKQYTNEEEHNLEKFHYPESLDDDRLFDINVPYPVLFGDAEAFGWDEAYKKLDTLESELSFSGVLKAYYEIDNPDGISETYSNRWKLFGMNTEQPLVTETSGNFNWEPGSDPSSGNFKWEPGTDPSVGWDGYDDFKIRMENFATFWYNRQISGFNTALKGYFNYDKGIEYPTFLDQNVLFFMNKFLSFVENEFNNE